MCGDRRLTYADTDARATRLAHHLADRGIGPGDHVALYLYNGTEYLEGDARRVQAARRPDQRQLPLRRGGAALPPRRLPTPRRSCSTASSPRSWPRSEATCRSSTPSSRSTTAPAWPRRARRGRLRGARSRRRRPFATSAPRSADDLYILYTGGTTGNPKGVMWRAEDIFFGALGGGGLGGEPITTPEQITDNLDANRRCLPACPFMHGTAHWFAFDTLFGGGTVVISPDRHFDAVRLWRLIDERVGELPGDRGRRVRRVRSSSRSTSSTRCPTSRRSASVLSGGAILSPAVKAAWVEALPATLLIDGFGSSEIGWAGSERGRRGRLDRRRAPFQRERRDHGARRRPAAGRRRRGRQARAPRPRARSATTRTRRRRPRRSP